MFSAQPRPGRAGRLAPGDDIDREFDEVYQAIVSGKGVRTDEEELALVNELIRRAEQGSYPENGAMHIISPRADVDWASDATMMAVQPAPARNYGLVAGGLLIGITLLVALLSLAGGGSKGGMGSAASATSLTSATATGLPVSSSQATQTAIAQATAVWAGAGIVVGSDYKQKLPPLYPETLEIDGVPFRIYPSAMDSGKWQYQMVEGTASWIGGTVINWSFGVPDLDYNMSLFERLAKPKAEGQGQGEGQGRTEAHDGDDGDVVALLRMSGGLVRHFRLQKAVQVERQQIEVFAQSQPGITIILLGDKQGSRRWVLHGTEDYARSGYGAGVEADATATPLPGIAQP